MILMNNAYDAVIFMNEINDIKRAPRNYKQMTLRIDNTEYVIVFTKLSVFNANSSIRKLCSSNYWTGTTQIVHKTI